MDTSQSQIISRSVVPTPILIGNPIQYVVSQTPTVKEIEKTIYVENFERVEILEQEIQKYKNIIKDKDGQIEALKNSIIQLELNLDSLQQQRVHLSELEIKYSVACTERDDLKEMFNLKDKTIEQLKEEINHLIANQQGFADKMRHKDALLFERDTEIVKLRQDLATFDSYKIRVTDAEKALSHSSIEIERLNNLLGHKNQENQQIKDLLKDQNLLIEENLRLKGHNEFKDREIFDLQSKYSYLIGFDQENMDLRQRLGGLETQIHIYQQDMNLLMDQLAKANKELELHANCNNLIIELANQNNENKKLIRQIEELQNIIKQLEDQLQAQNKEPKEKSKKAGRKGNPELTDQMNEDLKKKDAYLRQLQDKYDDLLQKYRDLQQQYKDLETVKHLNEQELIKKLEELQREIEGLLGEREHLLSIIKKLEGDLSSLKDYDVIVLKCGQLQHAMERLKKSNNEKDQKIQDLNNQLAQQFHEFEIKLAEELEKEREKLRALNENFSYLIQIEEQVKSKDDLINQLKANLDFLQNENERQAKLIRDLEGEIEKLKDFEILVLKVGQQQAALNRNKKVIQDKDNLIQELQEKLKLLSNEHDNELKQTQENSKSKVKDINDKFQYLLDIEARYHQLEIQLHDVLDKLKFEEGEKNKLQQRISELQSELDLYKDYQIIILKVSQQQQAIQTLKKNIADKEAKIKALEDSQSAKLAQLEAENRQALANEQQKVVQITQKYEYLFTLEGQIKELQDKLALEQQKCQRKAAKHKSYKNQLKDLKGQLDRYHDYDLILSKIQQGTGEIDLLKQKVLDLQKQLKKLTDSHAKLQQEKQAIQDEKDSLNQTLKKLELQIIALEEQLKGKSDQIAQLQNLIDKEKIESTRRLNLIQEKDVYIQNFKDFQLIQALLKQAEEQVKKLQEQLDAKYALIKEYQEKIVGLEASHLKQEAKLKEQDQLIQTLQQKVIQKDSELFELNDGFTKQHNLIENQKFTIQELEFQVEDLKKELLKFSDYELILIKYQQLQQQLNKLKLVLQEKDAQCKVLNEQTLILKEQNEILEDIKKTTKADYQKLYQQLLEKEQEIIKLQEIKRHSDNEIEQLNRKITRLEIQLNDHQDEIKQYQDSHIIILKYNQISSSLTKLKDQYDAKVQQNRQLLEKQVELEELISQHERQKKQSQIDLKRLQEQVNEKNTEIRQLYDELNKLKDELDSYKGKFLKKELECKNLKEELAKFNDYSMITIKLNQAELTIERQKKNLDEKEKQINELNAQVMENTQKLKEQSQKYEQKLIALIQENEKLKADGLTLLEDYQSIVSRYNDLEYKNKKQLQTIEELENEIRILLMKFQENEQRWSEEQYQKGLLVQKEIERLQLQITEYLNQIDNLNRQLEEQQIILISQKNNEIVISELNDQIRRLSLQIGFKDSEIGNLRMQLEGNTQYEKRIKNLTDEIDKSTRQNQELEKELANMRIKMIEQNRTNRESLITTTYVTSSSQLLDRSSNLRESLTRFSQLK